MQKAIKEAYDLCRKQLIEFIIIIITVICILFLKSAPWPQHNYGGLGRGHT